MAFTFKHGDRPLAGYTVQRGVGRGGFGEVYYAVADSGKEVALKYLRDNPQTELRGVNQCLNLKSPHLITIYDVKQSDEGEYFVVMEYVSGPSLRELLLDAPEGLGADKAVFFTDGIAKGLRYLHEQGIVHRDLKPGNIFYEDGYVKIGDYGLSKFVSASQHSAQTMSVGTVHYMAPEIGSGHYQPGTDIYALGVMLYEMLLGRVPFEGSSMGEILMKHLTEQPEVDALPDPFPTVIRKALAKDPADRYRNVDEMTAALFGKSELRDTLSRFDVSALSVRAGRVAQRVAVGAGGTGSSQYPPLPGSPDYDNTVTYRGREGRIGSAIRRVGQTIDRVGRKAGRSADRLGHQVARLDDERRDERPAFEPRDRLTAGMLGVFLGPLGVHRFYLGYWSIGIAQILVTFFTGVGALWGMIEGLIILTGGGMTDVYGRRLRASHDEPKPPRRSAFMQLVWGILSAVFLLGTLPLIVVPLFLDTPRDREWWERDFRAAGMELHPDVPPMAFLWCIAALVLALALFFAWKAGHGLGYTFWRATVRPLALAVCSACVVASFVFGSAYVGRSEQAAMLVIIGFFSLVGTVVWQIRGRPLPLRIEDRHREWALGLLFWLGASACFVALGLAMGTPPDAPFRDFLRDSFGGRAVACVAGLLTIGCCLEGVYHWRRSHQTWKLMKEARKAKKPTPSHR